jgi:hypothetical protein
MLSRILAVVFFFSPLVGFAQSIDVPAFATVHVYRQGRLLIEVSVSVDGNKVVSLPPTESRHFI